MFLSKTGQNIVACCMMGLGKRAVSESSVALGDRVDLVAGRAIRLAWPASAASAPEVLIKSLELVMVRESL